MKKLTFVGQNITNMPWEDRPKGFDGPVGDILKTRLLAVIQLKGLLEFLIALSFMKTANMLAYLEPKIIQHYQI